jgi:dihydroorotase-like cyclic amidohydrolase
MSLVLGRLVMNTASWPAKTMLVTLQAQSDGLPITLETTAHHLLFSEGNVPDGAVQYKCAPPLRSAANQRALQLAVEQGSIGVVSSDHSPSPAHLRKVVEGDFVGAWGGIAGLQYTLPALNTIARVRSVCLLLSPGVCRLCFAAPGRCYNINRGQIVQGWPNSLCRPGQMGCKALPSQSCARKPWPMKRSLPDVPYMQERGWTFSQLARMLSEQPARVAGLQDRKGAIKEGLDADLVIWQPYAAANTSQAACLHKHKETPYRDMKLQGLVQATFVQGALVYKHDQEDFKQDTCGSAVNL